MRQDSSTQIPLSHLSPAAHAKEQLSPGELAAVGKPKPLRRAIDRRHAHSEAHRDAAMLVELCAPELQPLACELACEVLLRQWRPVVRRFALVADQNNLAAMAFAMQGVDRLNGGVACANHHDAARHCLAAQPWPEPGCFTTRFICTGPPFASRVRLPTMYWPHSTFKPQDALNAAKMVPAQRRTSARLATNGRWATWTHRP